MVCDKKLIKILILLIFLKTSYAQTANDYVYCNTVKQFANGQTLLIYFSEPGNTKTTCEYAIYSAVDTYISVELYHNLTGSGTSCTSQYVQISPDGDPRYRTSVKYCGLRHWNNPLKFNTIGNQIRFRIVSNDLKRTVQVRMHAYKITASNCSCSWNPQTRVANGRAAASTTFTGNVAFITSNSKIFNETFCGGTIISASYILTAAHCVDYMEKIGLTNVRAHVGRQNVNNNVYSDTSYSDMYEIGSTTIHPNYNSQKSLNENDIALVRTTTSIRYSRGVGPACIPASYQNIAIPSRTTLTAIGFGATQFGKTSSADSKSWTLQQTPMIVNQTLQSGCNIVQRVCCQGPIAGTGRGDTCERDSGTGVYGYIANLFQLMGITSQGQICGLKSSFAVNVAVPYYLPWIRRVINGVELICNKS